MAARAAYGDARDNVVMEFYGYDRDALVAILDLVGPTDTYGKAYRRMQKVSTQRPELAYAFWYGKGRARPEQPSWDKFVDIWGSVIHWDEPFTYNESTVPKGKYTVHQISRRNYDRSEFEDRPPIPEPDYRGGALTKAARSSARKIREALASVGGDHKAAARLLFRADSSI